MADENERDQLGGQKTPSTSPLQSDQAEDRIRAIFGLTRDDPLPPADLDHLDRYHEYLSARLSFPFPALYVLDNDSPEAAEHPVTVVCLLSREDCDEENGLLCQVELQNQPIAVPLSDLEVDETSPNHQLIEDYSDWFANAPIEDFDDAALEQPAVMSASRRWKFRIVSILFGAVSGAVLGALVMAVWGTGTAMLIGGGVVGLLGFVTGRKVSAGTEASQLFASKTLVILSAVALVGALVGAMLGAAIMAALGTVPGAILGGMLGRLLGRTPVASVKGMMLGIAIGAATLAFYRDQDAATFGAMHGAWIGAATVALFDLVLSVLFRFARKQQ